MGDEPDLVDGVAVEAAGEMVVDSALGHAAEGEREVLAGGRRVGGVRIKSLAEDQLEVGGLGELGRAAEAAVLLVAALQQLRGGAAADCGGGFARLLRGQFDAQVEVLGELVGLLLDLRALLAPGARDAAQHIGPAGHPGAPLRGEVGAAEKGPAIGRAEDVERPAAVPVDQLDRLHVDVVDVGALLAIDFDAHNELVLQGGDLRVLE